MTINRSTPFAYLPDVLKELGGQWEQLTEQSWRCQDGRILRVCPCHRLQDTVMYLCQGSKVEVIA